MDDFEAVADGLYTVPPGRFVAARDEAVARARAAGDSAGAAALAKLRRPTVAAWLVNLLALRRPELVEQLTELATGLAEAQRELSGDRLRELASQRRRVVSALVATAQSLAVEADPGLTRSKLPRNEVAATLHAALVDRQLSERVRAGRLLKPMTYAGFGEQAPPMRLVPGEGGTEAAPPVPDPAELAAELDRARERAEAAASDLAQATAAQRGAEAELAELDAALADLHARRSAAADEVGRRETARLAARRVATAAQRRVDELAAALSAARRT